MNSEPAPGASDLLDEVRRFHAECMLGHYYESFDVTSRNCSDQSRGTAAFITEFHRLAARCVHEAETSPSQPVAQAFEVLFALLEHIDEGLDDVIFFADEGGAWSVGTDWTSVLPAYFRCLGQSGSAEEYAACVDKVIADFVEHDRNRYLTEAWHLATPAQRLTLGEPGPSKG